MFPKKNVLFFLFMSFSSFGQNDTLKTKKNFALKGDLVSPILGAMKNSYDFYGFSAEKLIGKRYSIQLSFIHYNYADEVFPAYDILNKTLLELKYFFKANNKSSFFAGSYLAYLNQGLESIGNSYPYVLISNRRYTKSIFNNSINVGVIGGYQFRIKKRLIIAPSLGLDHTILQFKDNILYYNALNYLLQLEIGIAF